MPICVISFVERARLLRGAAVLAFIALVVFPSAAASELKPLDISPAGASGSAPRIASDGAGKIAVVWRESNGDTSSIRAAVRTAGGVWQPSQRLSAPAVATESPKIAMDSLGNAVAVWQRSSGHDSVVEAAIRPAGGTWSEPQDLSTPGELAYNADVAASAGRVTAIWTVLRERRTSIESSSRMVTGSWAPAETVSGPVGNASEPKLAMDAQGGAVAVWRWSDGSFLVVQAAVRSEHGSWSPPEVLSGPGRSASQLHVAMDAEGNAVVGWLRYNGSWVAAQVTQRPAGGSWELPHNLSERGANAGGLDLAMNSRGEAVVTWVQGRFASNADLWSSFRSAGSSGWARVGVTQAWSGLQARVALDEAGNATAVWGGSATVSASFKPAGQAWQQNYLLSSYDFAAVQPAVTTQKPENATAVWIRAKTSDDQIQVVSYDVNTVKEQAEDEEDDEGDDEGDDEEEEGLIVQGTPQGDTLIGTPGNDVIYGYSGNDTIDGRGGHDIVYGGPGKDLIAGGTGADRLFGGDGGDVINGGRGSDVVRGGFGSDVVSSGRGRDVVYGAAGDDRIAGGSGRDLLDGGIGADRLLGGRGSDRILGGADRDRISGGPGNDRLMGGNSRDVLYGDSGDDTLRARDGGRDAVFGGTGLDLYGLDRWLDRARSIESRI
jgi:RTX calcium-binding nonapeptide repeat (4 copies)